MITIGNIQRKFVADIEGKDIVLADPNPHLSPEEVASFYAHTYPSLTNANVVGPTPDGDTLKYEFKNVIGTKG
ncbi:MAG: PRTRC system protein C [Cytophagaceae bacterium]|jgi:PRTRC genetic system protein C